MTDTEQAPILLPIYGSEDASNVIQLETFLTEPHSCGDGHCDDEDCQDESCGTKEECCEDGEGSCCEKKEEEEEETGGSPLEWSIQVVLTKESTEEDLEKGFEYLWSDEVAAKFPATIYFVGMTQSTGEMEEIPLFVGAVDQVKAEIEKQMKRERIKAKSKAKPKPFEMLFSQVCVFVKLIRPTYKLTEDDFEDENEEEHAEEEEEDPLEEPELLDESDLKALKDLVQECATKFDKGSQCIVIEDEKTGAERGLKIAEMLDFCDRGILINLVSETGFKGADFWDAMMSLGLVYEADMGSFAIGSEETIFFAVGMISPSRLIDPVLFTDPNYLVKHIQFTSFFPRCEKPIETVRGMINAAKYAQKRLGGTLLDESMKPLNDQEIEEEIEEVITKMKNVGVKPGSGFALELF